jgi:hypothetical protein
LSGLFAVDCVAGLAAWPAPMHTQFCARRMTETMNVQSRAQVARRDKQLLRAEDRGQAVGGC